MSETIMLPEEVAMGDANASEVAGRHSTAESDTGRQDIGAHGRPSTAPPGGPAPANVPSGAAGSTSTGGFYAGEHQPFDPRRKSPRMAAVLSVVPGLGQVYIGYYVRGSVIAGSILMLILLASSARAPVGAIFGFSTFFIWLFNLIDAGRMAAMYNHALAGSRAIEVPADFEMPAIGGSIVGGAALTVFALIALSNTALGWSLDWLERWWPIFPLALGAYLLVRGIMELNEGAAPDREKAAAELD